MTAHYAAPHRGGNAPVHSASNAALMIDFDNVTMGIRSDLTKELKNLLNSDIIRGKVAVQRAYADWRRYPQYIVPLSENSIDLIFAPAYGSSKKNATDIRLAIDALELVFTRPEIGTFILLSGDSDFSSLVLKLKEYGKYVIGVGIKESSSDLLVQNCDEYYSYNALTGLTRAGEEERGARMDPWELVQAAVERMAENDDVMRSDRLKQVMIELDEGFDEKAIGYSKYNRFLSDAATKGRLKLRKLENGQYEVAPAEGRKKSSAAPSRPSSAPAAAAASSQAQTPAPAAPAISLDASYDLLRRAVRDLVASGRAATDADVKRRMLELRADWDEAGVGFGRFSHFLRQAHNSEIIDLRRTSDGGYEVVLPGAAPSAPTDESDEADDQIATGAVTHAESPRARGGRERSERPEREGGRGNGRRGRRGGRDREEREDRGEGEERAPRSRGGRGRGRDRDAIAVELPPSEPRLSGDEATGTAPVAEEKPVSSAPATPRDAEPTRSRTEAPTPSAPTAAPSTTPAAPAAPAGLGRGRRGPRRGGPVAPPPLLPGQTIDLGGMASNASATGTPSTPVSTPAPEPSPEIHDVAPLAEQATASEPEERASRPSGPMPKLEGVLDPKQLGLPTEAGSVVRYLTNRYRGVGDKTAEQLVDAFGAEHVFAALKAAPDRVVDLLGAHRAGAVLDAWRVDYARRSGDEGAGVAPSRTRTAMAHSYDDDDDDADDGYTLVDPASIETPSERAAEPGTSDVERELPVDADAPERESAFGDEREMLAGDVERESTPDLWSNPREPRGE